MQRLDKFLLENKFFSSREKAKSAIIEGKVFVDGKIKAPSYQVSGDEKIEIKTSENYVSRGAYKLLRAIDMFGVSLKNLIVLDIGASTGGFSQVALENGAKKVYALDVGTNQLDEKIKANPNVVDLSGCDFRGSPKIDDVDFIVSDLSFISLKLIIPEIIKRYGKNIPMILLFKPQFECGREVAKTKNGVIKDKKIHKKILFEFVEFLKNLNLNISGFTFSSITGKNGNIEYLFYLNGERQFSFNIEEVCDRAFDTLA